MRFNVPWLEEFAIGLFVITLLELFELEFKPTLEETGEGLDVLPKEGKKLVGNILFCKAPPRRVIPLRLRFLRSLFLRFLFLRVVRRIYTILLY